MLWGANYVEAWQVKRKLNKWPVMINLESKSRFFYFNNFTYLWFMKDTKKDSILALLVIVGFLMLGLSLQMKSHILQYISYGVIGVGSVYFGKSLK